MESEHTHPLSDSECDCLDRVIKSSRELTVLIDKCKECKLDFAQEEARNNALAELAAAMKRTFFPHRP